MNSYRKKPRTLDAIICLCFFAIYYFLFDFSVSFIFMIFMTIFIYSSFVYLNDKRIMIAFTTLLFFAHDIVSLPTIDFNHIEGKVIENYALNFNDGDKNYTVNFSPTALFLNTKKTLTCIGKVTKIKYAPMITIKEEEKNLILSASCLHNGQRVTFDLQEEYAERLNKYILGVWVYLLNSITYFLLVFLRAFQRF